MMSKVRSLSSVLALALMIMVTAMPVEVETRDAGMMDWPEVAGGRLLSVRRETETNGDRIKRGLAPLPPARRYKASPTIQQLRPRISPAPPSSGSFTFRACANDITATDNLLNGSVSGFYSASSNQEAADLCASAATDRGFTSFDIVFVSAFQQYQCSGGIKSYTAATCDENNAAIYFTS